MRLVAFSLGLAVMAPVFAGEADTVTASGAWVREVPPGADMTAVFVQLDNAAEKPAVVIAAESPAAGSVELHGHSHEHGVIQMRPVERLSIPAKGKVALAPGGLHLMVFELKTKLVVGGEFPVLLKFEDGSTLTLKANVRSATE